jgi:LysR family pca operon transcriptional activator
VLSSEAVWVAPQDAVRVDVRHGELAELALGIEEPGGSVGICSNSALALPLPAQEFCAVLREVAGEYREGSFT